MIADLKAYPEYKDSGLPWLGNIPVDWQIIRTKHLFRLCTEKAPINNSFELLSVYTHIGVKPRKELEQRGNRASSTDEYWIVKRGDIIVNKLLAWMGAIGVSHYDGVTSPAYDILRRIRPLNPDFYHYLFRTGIYLREFKSRSTGIMEMRLRLYFDKFGQIPLVYPPLIDQTAIVQFLDYYGRLVNQAIHYKRQLIELLNEQKQIIIHKAVTRGLDPNVRFKPSGIDWLGDVPEHWEVKKLKWLTQFNPPKSDSLKNLKPDDRVVFLPMERIGTDGKIDASEYRLVAEVWQGFTHFHRYDVVVAKITPCFENGKGAYLCNLPTEYGFGTTELIVLRANQQIDPEYLYLLTTLKKLRKLGADNMTGAAGQQRVPLEFLRQFVVPVPPVIEQRSILKSLLIETEELAKTIDYAHREIDLLREYRIRLIADIVTGKLDVRGVELPAMDEAEPLEDIDIGECAEIGAEELIQSEEATNADE
jgi:type I restriction enzyme S subunit